MADSVKKGVIVEFDFAAMDGAKLLFTITKNFLSALDKIPFDERIEAQHLAGLLEELGLPDAAELEHGLDESHAGIRLASTLDATDGFLRIETCRSQDSQCQFRCLCHACLAL